MASEPIKVEVSRPRNGVRGFTAEYEFQDSKPRLTKPKRGKPVPARGRDGKVIQEPLGERIVFEMSGKLIESVDDFGSQWSVNELTIKAPPGVRISGRTKAAAPLGRVEAMADALSLGLDLETRVKLIMPDDYESTQQVTIDHAFLSMVAQSWLFHTTQGSRNVNVDMLNESKLVDLRGGDEQKARFLLTSWIRKCREEGLLPASRKRQQRLSGFEAAMAEG